MVPGRQRAPPEQRVLVLRLVKRPGGHRAHDSDWGDEEN